MITGFRLHNFKSWRDTGRVECAPLTGFFGTNSSGKTTILQMLLLLKQTVESPDRKRVLHTGDERSLVDVGTLYDLIYRHQADLPLEIQVGWKLPKPLRTGSLEKGKLLPVIKHLSFGTRIRMIAERPVVERFTYNFMGSEFGMQRKLSDSRDEYEVIRGVYPLKRTRGRPVSLTNPVKCYGFPEEVFGAYQNVGFLADLTLEFEKLFSRIAYLGPLREYPHRSYLWAGDRPVDVGRRGENAIAALLAARTEGLKSGRGQGRGRRYKQIEQRILEWMREMSLIDSFSLRPIGENRKDYEFTVTMTEGGPEVLITDIGFGVSQILPVLVLCYYVPEGSIVILEQPEIHLHPSVQAGLADVLIDVVKERSVQIIVESHSEHLLRRLQRRIAEERMPHSDTALYFCRLEGDTSVLERLDLDMFGNIRNWPPNFFGDEMGDLAAMTDAAMRRIGTPS